MAKMKNTARKDGRVQSKVYIGNGKYKYVYAANNKELQEKDRILAEQERQLTESRIATMVSQIRPHFIYNTRLSEG